MMDVLYTAGLFFAASQISDVWGSSLEVYDSNAFLSKTQPWPEPPTWKNRTLTARYVVHYADWTVVSGISPTLKDTPFGVVQSYADGPLERGEGTPYFYMSTMSTAYYMITTNPRVSMTVSEQQGPLCAASGLDPEEPPCAEVVLSGQMVTVPPAEVEFATSSLFARHPAMKDWPIGHDWRLYKLNLTSVWVIDFYGGAVWVSPCDYFRVKMPSGS